jgi:putative membrane protein
MRITRVAAVLAVVGLLVIPGTAAYAAPSTQDTTYLQAAHQANLAEIAGGQIAQRRGATPQVRELGGRFVRDHTALDSTLTTAAAALGVTLPAQPDPAQLALADRYLEVAPAEFDALFVTSQLTAHRAAMMAGKKELTAGSDERARQVAAAAAPVIASHHTALRAARQDLNPGYGTPTR